MIESASSNNIMKKINDINAFVGVKWFSFISLILIMYIIKIFKGHVIKFQNATFILFSFLYCVH